MGDSSAVVGVALLGGLAYLLYVSGALDNVLGGGKPDTTDTSGPGKVPKCGGSDVRGKDGKCVGCVPTYENIPDSVVAEAACCERNGVPLTVTSGTCMPIRGKTTDHWRSTIGHQKGGAEAHLLFSDLDPAHPVWYVNTVDPVMDWSVSGLPGNWWCHADIAFGVIEANGGGVTWLERRPYPGSKLQEESTPIQLIPQIIRRPIAGYAINASICLGGPLGCLLGCDPWNIFDSLQVNYA